MEVELMAWQYRRQRGCCSEIY